MWRFMWITILTLTGCLLWNSMQHQTPPAGTNNLPNDPPFLGCGKQWVDSVMNSMSDDEKIGQLFMLAAYSNKDAGHVQHIESMIRDYNIGGLIFMQGGPVRQSLLLNRYQHLSKVPLLIAMDAEWSLSMRLDSTVSYPRQMMIGATRHEQLIYEMGAEFARQLKRMGVHVNFAPVIDVNNNPDNPVINTRSFGENPERVARQGWLYSKGMQDNHVLAVGKHFPGHGDTDTDSHKDLPIITHNRQRLDSIELEPFRYCIRKGIGALMIAHLYMPAFDSTPNLPTTLSKPVVTDLLRRDMGFKGLIFTDALNMQGVAKFYAPGEADLLALLAGNDILLFSGDVPRAVRYIKKAIADGRITQQEIDEKCRRILEAKYWAGLHHYEPIALEGLVADLNSPEALLVQQRLVESSLTVVTNRNSLLPLLHPDSMSVASLSFGTGGETSFQNRLSYYDNVKHFVYNRDLSGMATDKLLQQFKAYSVVLVSLHNLSSNQQNKFGIAKNTIDIISKLSEQTEVVVVVFGTAYALQVFDTCPNIAAVVAAYNDWDITRDFAAQLVYGGIASDAALPVSAGKSFREGMGEATPKIRLKYTRVPEEAGIDSKKIPDFDAIVNEGINNAAYPGAQVFAARNGIVFYQKSFGYHSYDKKRQTGDFDIYDMASVTKIMATTLSLMKLWEQKKFALTDKLSDHFPALKNTDKSSIVIADVLAHQARFTPWIPFYAPTIKTDSLRKIYYAEKPDKEFSIEVCGNMYMRHDYRDSIFKEIYDSKLLAKKEYRYSDLGMIIFGETIELLSQKTLDVYATENFYTPIGAGYTYFNPLQHTTANNIVPTENDTLFRRQIVHGYVHDQASAMLGGVAGHAGLFSNANDIGKLSQMLLQRGEYGGRRYFAEETVEYFTTAHYEASKNRRGLGFDKPLMSDRGKGPACKSASASSYGHSGFTGTYFWVDPETKLVYVFICNRTYPVAENNKIISLNTRTKLHQAMYDAIITDTLIVP